MHNEKNVMFWVEKNIVMFVKWLYLIQFLNKNINRTSSYGFEKKLQKIVLFDICCVFFWRGLRT